jgi:hypothetical protein
MAPNLNHLWLYAVPNANLPGWITVIPIAIIGDALNLSPISPSQDQVVMFVFHLAGPKYSKLATVNGVLPFN